ncbi:endonuclease-reverse transcriptase [Danaus plexippus plexippus]|uniref:Endonuclease-reverse transcriptase n=1 Tax=Danaus plexippus plexippus TaxID=278856 RepID=A0A212FJU1_DANPL|nr:endonuclease-reverse transcriptase [Danaus plexippus plexippus]
MADLLKRLKIISEDKGLAINKNNTKIMLINLFATIQRTDLLKTYEAVEQFQYLGSVITNRGSCEPEIRRRICTVKTALTQCILAFFGHVARRITDNRERFIMTGKMDGKRPRGRNPKMSDLIPEHLEIPASVALHQATKRA